MNDKLQSICHEDFAGTKFNEVFLGSQQCNLESHPLVWQPGQEEFYCIVELKE
jgi:hypothetical protein